MSEPPHLSVVEHLEPAAPDAVEMLEDMLIHARNGEFSALALIGVRPNGRFTFVFTKPVDAYRLLGAATRLQAMIMEEMDDG